MTSKELDERIEDEISRIYSQAWSQATKNMPFTETQVRLQTIPLKQLIRDCIAEVTPEYGDQKDYADSLYHLGFSDVIDTINQNTKELLG